VEGIASRTPPFHQYAESTVGPADTPPLVNPVSICSMSAFRADFSWSPKGYCFRSAEFEFKLLTWLTSGWVQDTPHHLNATYVGLKQPPAEFCNTFRFSGKQVSRNLETWVVHLKRQGNQKPMLDIQLTRTTSKLIVGHAS
jgi:hypothetical protein